MCRTYVECVDNDSGAFNGSRGTLRAASSRIAEPESERSESAQRPMFLFQHNGQVYTRKSTGAVAAQRRADRRDCTGGRGREASEPLWARLDANYGDTDRIGGSNSMQECGQGRALENLVQRKDGKTN